MLSARGSIFYLYDMIFMLSSYIGCFYSCEECYARKHDESKHSVLFVFLMSNAASSSENRSV